MELLIDCLSTGALSGHNNTIGGLTAGSANVISANRGAGVAIECAGASGNLVQGNLIGTDSTGLDGLGGSTSAAGVLLWASFNGSVTANTVGGSVTGARNVVAGNTFDGMRLGAAPDGIAVTGNFVLGNYVGVGLSGLVVPNQRSGIRLDRGANANTIGGGRAGLPAPAPAT